MKSKKLIRQKFRDEVFGRDGYKCVFCGKTNNLDAHHITNRNEMPNGGYVKENGITLCPVHHSIEEEDLAKINRLGFFLEEDSFAKFC